MCEDDPLGCSPASADMLVSLKPCFCSSLAEPCPRCAAPYGFQNVMTLSSDTGRFSVSVQQIVSPSQLRNLFSSVVFFFYVFVVLFSLLKHQQVFEVIQTNLDMPKFFILKWWFSFKLV